MKITGQTSIRRLQAYINLQKQLGNSLIGDYVLFLKQEEQTNSSGKTFNNYILDIMKKEDFNSSHLIPKKETNQASLSTNNKENVNNITESKQTNITKEQIIATTIDLASKTTEISMQDKKESEKKASKKTTKSTRAKTTKVSIDNSSDNQEQIEQKEDKNKDNFENYYSLIETKTTVIPKNGVQKEYLVANFVDMNDKQIDVIIKPELSKELLECDLGTVVKLDLAVAGKNTFTNNIEYIQKCIKNIAA